MTLQAIYDRVKSHLLTQNAKSQLVPANVDDENTICAYRGEGDRRCAIGCLITDECYTEALEGKTLANHKTVVNALVCSGVIDPHEQRSSPRATLLVELQRMHDRREVSEWSDSLRRLAIEHSLTP